MYLINIMFIIRKLVFQFISFLQKKYTWLLIKNTILFQRDILCDL